jgi:hypothetical protein
MKRILWMIPVILVSVGFFSCSMDGEDDDNPFAGPPFLIPFSREKCRYIG